MNERGQGKKLTDSAGLDTNYRGIPFEPIPQLLAIAEYITKTLAVCMKCGAPANKTQRITKDSSRLLRAAGRINLWIR